MVAYADLGGLGLKQGTPVVYDWVMPSLMPVMLPWLAILALLLLKPNRCASAWWVWVPLGCVAGVASVPPSVVDLLTSYQVEVVQELVGALGFGLAALWLVSGYLGWKHRMLAFLGTLLALEGFSLLAFAVRQGWEEMGTETLVVGISLTVSVGVISVAVSLAGLVCRGRHGWLRLSLWLIAALVVIWQLVSGPFYVISHVPGSVIFGVVGVVAVLTFAVLLPFLVLSFVNGFYWERLKGLLHLDSAAPPTQAAGHQPG